MPVCGLTYRECEKLKDLKHFIFFEDLLMEAHNKLIKQAQEEEKLRAIQREKENRLSMQMLDATMQLSIVTANALTGGHNNGNVEAAKKAAEDASRAYKAFLMDTAAHNIS